MIDHENTITDEISPTSYQNAKSDDDKFIEAVKCLDLKEYGSKKPMTPEELIKILKEDVVYAFERPGSWEGSNMLTVLNSHGFISF